MKKAKEYANQFTGFSNQTEFSEIAFKVVNEMIQEIAEVSKLRKVQSNSAVKSIIKEQDQKWKALCNLINKEDSIYILKRSGFIEALKIQIPTTVILLNS